MVLAWVTLSGLPSFMYKRRILKVVRGLVGSVAKVDFNTNSKIRGLLARMVNFLDLDRLLVFQVWVNRELQRVEYEALPTICFSCGKCGHLKEMCPSPVVESNNVIGKVNGDSGLIESINDGEGFVYGSLIMVEQKFQWGQKDLRNQRKWVLGKVDDGVVDEAISSDVAKIKGKSKSVMQNWGKGIALLKRGEVGLWWNKIIVWAVVC
ncbi:hypothetical protein Golob_004181 [Gossypium lobatum]|uniref:CCHC-type domain-containing protein n=1 Tax=Gossypium lobatum TaxID=34289 RepID=A0A7J8N147_9ROSI|nr:hypothetical protein [Gossypium lobatum]